ncbi:MULTISPECIES: lipid II flippase MurJ [Methylocaldum]|jgi:peptidoglycan biosynthesis protein MviN/MurJ (putative lipid II flippase)|uniref:lipid II flippase MurJ n=1 Tax=Methylocaldum sp. GT1BB TaxID=3438963 RepID=UPI003DA111F8
MQLSAGLGVAAVVAVWLTSPPENGVPYPLFAGIFTMVGAAVYASFPSGILNARDKYALPGLLWGLRVIPLLFWGVVRPEAEELGWLMFGIGCADLVRAFWLDRRALHQDFPSEQGGWSSLDSYIPVVLASIFSGLNPIVDRFIAVLAGEGAVSVLEVGERFYGLLATFATIGVMNLVLVRLSQACDCATFESLYQRLTKIAVLWAAAWTLLGWSGWVILGDWLMAHVIRVTPEQVSVINSVYFCNLIGLPAFILGLVGARAYLARGWQRSLIRLSILSVIVNAGLSLILFYIFGVPGIALATSSVYITVTLTMYVHLFQLSRKVPLDSYQSSP